MEIVYCEVRISRKCDSSRGYPWSSSVLQKVPKFGRLTACFIYSPQYADIKTQPKFSTHSDTPPTRSFSTKYSAFHRFIFLIFQNFVLSPTRISQKDKRATFVHFQCPCNNTMFLTPLPLSFTQVRLRVSGCSPPVLPPSDSCSRQQ
jgi:hypothetical protein